MKKIVFSLIFTFLFPTLISADGGGFNDFRLYKKPLLKWIEIAQTESMTELLYHRRVIKTYQNAEFATELLTHSPDEDPDCYNSIHENVPTTRAKNIVGKDYLRACLVLQTRLIRNRYILFLGPSTDGNRVSIYDIRKEKFSHAIVNNALSMKTLLNGGIIFLTRNIGSSCEKSILLYKDGISRILFDECSFQNAGWPTINIDTYRVMRSGVEITYTPYVENASGNIVLDPRQKSKKTIKF